VPIILLPDDELLARLLIDTWTLTTGKALRSDVPPQELTEEELIDFWCDDYFDSVVKHWYWPGRHQNHE
jgi:hypothetical protein